MLKRWILVLTCPIMSVGIAQAQPWPTRNAKADAALESALSAGENAGALKRTTTSNREAVHWEIADAAQLAENLRATKSTLTDAFCDAAVLHWRDDATNRLFWTAYMRAIATATERPRDKGFADLLEGVAYSGSAPTVEDAETLYASAREHFRTAKDRAWVAGAETEIGNLALAREHFAEADAAYVRAAELYTAARGAKNPLVASVVLSRGNVAFRQQKHGEAIKFYREALDMLGADDGPNAMVIAGYLQNLASAHIGNQNAPAAKEAIERGLAIIRNAEGEQSARQLPFLEVLGQIYQSRHEIASARDISYKALEISRKEFGETSVATVRYINNLANHEGSLGKGTVALKLHHDALKILEQQPAKDETEIADVRASLGDDYKALAKPDEAVTEYQRALEGYRKGTTRRDRGGEILTLAQLAALLGEQGKASESRATYREAIAAAVKTLGAKHPFLTNLKRNLGLRLLEDGAYAEGAVEFRSARVLIDKVVKPIEWADLTANIAMALEMADEIREAEQELNEAIAIYRREQHPHLAGAYTTLASIHRKRDDYEESARVDRLALEIQMKALGPKNEMTLILRGIVARDEQYAGNYVEAEKSLQELAAIKKELHGPNHPEYVKVLTDIAAVRAEAGQLTEAITAYEDVLKLQRASKVFPLRDRINSLTELARLLEKRRNLDRAVETLNEARVLLNESGLANGLSYANVLFQLGGIAETKGDMKSAELHFSEEMEIHRKLRAVGQSNAFLTIKRLAEIRKNAGDLPGASHWIEEGLAALAVEPPVNGFSWRLSAQSADLLTLKAEVLLRTDRSIATQKTAYRLLATAGDITDRLRFEERSSVEAKAGLIGAVQSETLQLRLTVCEMLAQAEPAGEWRIAAFRAAEESRARVFLEQLGRSRSDITGDLPAEAADRERKNGQDLERLRRELEGVESAPFDQRETARVAALQKAIGDATRIGEELQALIARDYPRVAALRRPYPCSVEEARAVLAKNEAAILFCCGKKVSYAIVLQPAEAQGNGLDLIPLPGTDEFEDDLEVLISENNLKVADLYRDKGAKIYRALIAPLEHVLSHRDLLIIPDGKLGLLAFETLIDAKGRFLIESRAIRIAPSMTALHLNRLWEQKRPRPTRAILAIGDPITSGTDDRLAGQALTSAARRLSRRTGEHFDRLVYSAHEASAVADVFHAPLEDRWLGLDASEGRLKSWNSTGRLAEYRFLHFATHGVLGAGKYFPPALVLSLTASPSPDAEDGFLSLSEVSRLQLNADLVVLSACRSARGELRTGEGVTSLARGFLNAGARGVVCSLWPVDDQDTAALMVDIYKHLDSGIPASTAIRNAKLRLINEGKQPFDWAPFILVGASD